MPETRPRKNLKIIWCTYSVCDINIFIIIIYYSPLVSLSYKGVTDFHTMIPHPTSVFLLFCVSSSPKLILLLFLLHCVFSYRLWSSFVFPSIYFQITSSFHRFIIFSSQHMTHPFQNTPLHHFHNSFFQTQSFHERTCTLSRWGDLKC